jgi:DNA-directed RNA polymerase subunit RPC12/RpoP
MEVETYQCESCGKTFESGWTNDEAEAEYAINFPEQPVEQGAVVCDSCYQAMMQKFRPRAVQ